MRTDVTWRSLGWGLLLGGVILAAFGFVVGRVGVEHEIAKIPAETRAQMGDFDWIGVEWITRFAIMAIVGVAMSLSGAVILALWHLRRRAQLQ